MINYNLLTAIQILIFVLYVGFLLLKFKKPLPSISESWYALGYPLQILFTVFCYSLAISMFFRVSDEWGVLYFLSAAGFGFVGAATQFKDSFVRPVHFIGAMVGIMAALAGIGFNYGDWLPAVAWLIPTIFVLGYNPVNVTNKMWWIEIAAFICIVAGFVIGKV